MERSRYRRITWIVSAAALTLVGAAAFVSSGSTAPRRASVRAPQALAAPAIDASPRIDMEAMERALARVGLTPEKRAELQAQARGDERARALATIRSAADPFEQRVAVFTLWNSRQVDDEAVDAVLALLATDPSDVGLVVESLQAIKESLRADVHAETLTRLRSSASPAVRLAAAKALHFRAGQDVTRALSAQAAVETDEVVRRRLVLALGTRALTDPSALAELETLSRFASDATTRDLAAAMLAESHRNLEILAGRG